MFDIRRAADRGLTRFDWLDSRHTFSFGSYFAPEHQGVSVLRVINDDTVAPGGGFSAHSHQDMEILTCVLDGVVEHQDSLGHVERLPAGELQLMTAGTGITHSEYNASQFETLHFLQIWLIPSERQLPPGYQQLRIEPGPGRRLILSPDGRDGSLLIHQDALAEHIRLDSSGNLQLAVPNGRIGYLHLIRGSLSDASEQLNAGDGVAFSDDAGRWQSGAADTEALLFDLPGRG